MLETDPSSGGVTTVIGPDAVLQGDLDTTNGVRVQGLVEGSIQTRSRIVVEGRARGRLTGALIEVHGRTEGELEAREAIRFGTACRVEGRVVAGSVRIDDGADLAIRIEAGNGHASNPRERLEAELSGGG